MLPYLPVAEQKSKKYTINFGGLNLGYSPAEGELSDAFNLSTADYPCLTQRQPREAVSVLTSPTGLYSNNKLCYVNGTGFYYDGVLKGTVTEGKKQFATIGAKIVIFPDKKYYNETEDEFGSLEASFTGAAVFTASAITGTGFSGFKAGDGLTISGCVNKPENNKTLIVREVSGDTLTFYDNSFEAGEETEITIKREVPDLDFICESNNRLWGCKDNTIYASKPGEPENFNVFDGLSDDSYQLVCGTPEDFTGCIEYGSCIIFFKENCIHKIMGTKPSNYQLIVSQAEGLQRGCEKSVVIINETVFYKGHNGIMAYTGSVPETVSLSLGNARFSDAVSGSDNERYYVSMKKDEKWQLFVYDIVRNLWTKEDDTCTKEFTYFDGHLYFIDHSGLFKMNSGTEKVKWSATLGDINETQTEKKGYSRFSIRAELEKDAFLEVEINPDYSGWKRVYRGYANKKRILNIPISPPTRCDSVKIRLSGQGKCTIFAIAREYAVHSER